MSSGARHASRCAILIGGAGERIGGEKHLRTLLGRPLGLWAIDAGRHAHLEPLLVAKHGTRLGPLAGECEVAIEDQGEHHALIGVTAALELTGEPLVACPCDMPLLPGELLRELAEASGPTIVAGPHGEQPLLGRFDPDCVPLLREAIEAGASARAAVAELGAARIEGDALAAFGDPVAFLRNVNTTEELAALERELSAGAA